MGLFIAQKKDLLCESESAIATLVCPFANATKAFRSANMLVVTDPSGATRISNPAIQKFVSARMQQLAPVLAPDEPEATCDATFVVLEAGDAVSELDQAVGFSILRSFLDDLPFGDPDYYPSFEIMEEHNYGNTRIYELVFIGNDDGAATAIVVPDEEGIDADLLALCRSFAIPAVNSPWS